MSNDEPIEFIHAVFIEPTQPTIKITTSLCMVGSPQSKDTKEEGDRPFKINQTIQLN